MANPTAIASPQDALAALVTAWRSLSSYPPGHPARAQALEAAHRKLHAFTAGAGALRLGVEKEGLVWGETRLRSPNVSGLARALHARGVALIVFEEAVAPAALEALLARLGGRREGDAALAEELRAAGVLGIEVTGVDFDQLALEGLGPGRAPRDLWQAILRALLTGRQLDAAGHEASAGESYSAEAIARLFQEALARGDSGASVEALAAAVGGHLERSQGAARELAVHQVAELVRALPADVREPVLAAALRTLATDEGASDAVAELAQAVSPDEMLQALRRLNAGGGRLSSHALRMVQTLAAAAGRERAERTALGKLDTDALALELSMIFKEEDIDRYNPEDHQALVEQAAAVDLAGFAYLPEEPLALEGRGDTITDLALSNRLVETLLDFVAGEGDRGPAFDRLQALFGACLADGRLDDAIALVEAFHALIADPALPEDAREATREFLGRLAESQQVMGMVAGMGQSRSGTAEKLGRLVQSLGQAAARSLLGALANEKDQSRRRRLFDLLVSLGPVMVPEAKRLLADSRWYVVRNMLVLLRAVDDRSSLPEVRRVAKDSDLRVRLEAIKTLLAFDPEPPLDLLEKAILDPDPKLAEVAVALTGQYGIAEAREPLLGVLRRWDVFGARRSLRLKALRALADIGDPSVLPRLSRFFRDWRLPLVALEERRAAYKALESYPADARQPWLEQGLRSRDPKIRESCHQLQRTQPAPPEPPVGEEPA